MYNYDYRQYPYQQNTYAFVDGIEGARAYQVAPNSMMLLMDSQNPVCYKKQTDMYGKTIALEIFDLVPHKQDMSNEYITKAEFEKAIAELKGGMKDESV